MVRSRSTYIAEVRAPLLPACSMFTGSGHSSVLMMLRELKYSVNFCSTACDGVKGLTKDIADLRAEIKELGKLNVHLKAENERLSQRVNELEQYQRANNLEIKGVPGGNDVMTVIKSIGVAVGESISESDIDTCHWVSTAQTGVKNIVVRFVQRMKRNRVHMKARKKHLTCEDLGLTEHLTQQN